MAKGSSFLLDSPPVRLPEDCGVNLATARILVVDDEPLVLSLVATALERAGHQVASASGPLQALEIVKSQEPFDLVVSDVVMPGMCGTQLASEIRRLAPSSAILFMSGCVPVTQLPSGAPFIGKPFATRDLLRAVDRALQPPAREQAAAADERQAPAAGGAGQGA
jgi:DNA-binding NtrC family response regulator